MALTMRLPYMHTIEIEQSGPTTFTVWYEGQMLLQHSRNPEFDACRELLNRGITGKLITRHSGSNVISFILDIQKSAELTVLEGAGRPRFRKWCSFMRGSAQDGES